LGSVGDDVALSQQGDHSKTGRAAAGGRNAAMVAGGRNAVRGGGARNGRALQTRQSTGPAAGGTACGGVKNYSADEVDLLLQCIRRVVPIRNDQWDCRIT
jgi:hypothetical protein